jgi:hypothetical protein
MTSYIFQVQNVKKALSIIRTVKPEDDDFRIKFSENSMIVSSADKRRKSTSIVASVDSSTSVGYMSDEFSIPFEKKILFEPESDMMSISINDESISISGKSDVNKKRASIKKRVNNKLSLFKIPDIPDNIEPIKSNALIDIINHVSPSAKIDETKSEEDMRLNQVHFFKNHVVASARFYASVVELENFPSETSIVSSDIPLIKSFCSKIGTKNNIFIHDDGSRIHFSSNNSFLTLSKVQCLNRPTPSVFGVDEFKIRIRIKSKLLSESLNWVDAAIEGTQRITLLADCKSNTCKFMQGTNDLASIDVNFLLGDGLKIDLPARVLNTVIENLESEYVDLLTCHPKSANLFQIYYESGPLKITHMMQKMKER